MLKVVFAKQNMLPDTLETLNDDIFSDANLVGPEYYKRLKKVVQVYIDKHWIL